MGFDYEICYKKDRENVVVDGLSRIPTAKLTAISMSSISSEILEQVKQSWLTDDNIQVVISKLNNGESNPKYAYSQGLLYRNVKVVVGSNVELHSHIIELFHDSSMGGPFWGGCDCKKGGLSVLVEWLQ